MALENLLSLSGLEFCAGSKSLILCFFKMKDVCVRKPRGWRHVTVLVYLYVHRMERLQFISLPGESSEVCLRSMIYLLSYEFVSNLYSNLFNVLTIVDAV